MKYFCYFNSHILYRISFREKEQLVVDWVQ